MRQKIASYALKRALPPSLHPEGQRSQTFTGSVGRGIFPDLVATRFFSMSHGALN